MPDRFLLACKGTSVAAALVAGALVAVAPSTDVAPVTPVLARTRTAPPAVVDSSAEAAALVVETNVFSPTREAPEARTFAGDGGAAGDDTGDAGDVALDAPDFGTDSTADPLAPRSEDPVPHLYGIVQGPAGDAALLRLDRAGRGGRLFRTGEGAGGWRVASIGTDQVTLAGAGGARVLRLPRRAP